MDLEKGHIPFCKPHAHIGGHYSYGQRAEAVCLQQSVQRGSVSRRCIGRRGRRMVGITTFLQIQVRGLPGKITLQLITQLPAAGDHEEKREVGHLIARHLVQPDKILP